MWEGSIHALTNRVPNCGLIWWFSFPPDTHAYTLPCVPTAMEAVGVGINTAILLEYGDLLKVRITQLHGTSTFLSQCWNKMLIFIKIIDICGNN